MGLGIYWNTLIALVPLVVFVAGHGTVLRLFHNSRQEDNTNNSSYDEVARQFRRTFLQVYLLVMGSEWLQGPYMYSLFRNKKNLDEATVALLYISTYTSAAVAAFFTGYIADKFGRRAACLVFCGIHYLASVSVCFDRLEILILGRVLGGIGITLLWTTFESWMVAEYNARGLNQSSIRLSTMFGTMTTSNCTTAVLAGVLGYCVVLVLGSKADPFMVGIALDFCAAILMLRTWNENRDHVKNTRLDSPDEQEAEALVSPSSGKTTKALKDGRVWILSFVSCCFEGTVFLLMFFWPGTLQEAHDREHPDENGVIPYGVTFAAFMAAMALGALMFNIIGRRADWGDNREGKVHKILTPTRLLATALLLSAVSFLIAALARKETHLFSAFLLFEICNGIYVPSMAYHRGMIVSDSGRSRIYSLMNIPLFVFVVVALCTTGGTGGDQRQTVFISCAALLFIAVVMTMFGLNISSGPMGFQEILGTDINGLEMKTDNQFKV